MSSVLKGLISVALSVRQMDSIINIDAPSDNTCAYSHIYIYIYI